MSYHHGNARAALLQAAAKLLEKEGAANLSLRRLSQDAGLSRQAPYNHFADKEALLAELVREGFALLGAEIDAIRMDLPPSKRLALAGERYIAFGQTRPALFRLMFSKELVDISKHSSAQNAAAAALAGLSAIIATIAPVSDPADAMLVAWSLVHGYTCLCIETGLEGSGDRRRRAKLFGHTVEALIRGDIPGS